MQKYIYDKSLNLYFGYKGRNSHIPSLSPSNLKVSILGKQYFLSSSSALDLKGKIRFEQKNADETSPKKSFSKSDPPHKIMQRKANKNAEKEEEKDKKIEELDSFSENKEPMQFESKTKKKKGFWKSIISWPRKSNTDIEKMQKKIR